MSKPLPEIAPCPFCWSEKISPSTYLHARHLHFGSCYNCGAHGPTETNKLLAILAWSRRAEK